MKFPSRFIISLLWIDLFLVHPFASLRKQHTGLSTIWLSCNFTTEQLAVPALNRLGRYCICKASSTGAKFVPVIESDWDRGALSAMQHREHAGRFFFLFFSDRSGRVLKSLQIVAVGLSKTHDRCDKFTSLGLIILWRHLETSSENEYIRFQLWTHTRWLHSPCAAEHWTLTAYLPRAWCLYFARGTPIHGIIIVYLGWPREISTR